MDSKPCLVMKRPTLSKFNALNLLHQADDEGCTAAHWQWTVQMERPTEFWGNKLKMFLPLISKFLAYATGPLTSFIFPWGPNQTTRIHFQRLVNYIHKLVIRRLKLLTDQNHQNNFAHKAELNPQRTETHNQSVFFSGNNEANM